MVPLSFPPAGLHRFLASILNISEKQQHPVEVQKSKQEHSSTPTTVAEALQVPCLIVSSNTILLPPPKLEPPQKVLQSSSTPSPRSSIVMQIPVTFFSKPGVLFSQKPPGSKVSLWLTFNPNRSMSGSKMPVKPRRNHLFYYKHL